MAVSLVLMSRPYRRAGELGSNRLVPLAWGTQKEGSQSKLRALVASEQALIQGPALADWC